MLVFETTFMNIFMKNVFLIDIALQCENNLKFTYKTVIVFKNMRKQFQL